MKNNEKREIKTIFNLLSIIEYGKSEKFKKDSRKLKRNNPLEPIYSNQQDKLYK